MPSGGGDEALVSKSGWSALSPLLGRCRLNSGRSSLLLSEELSVGSSLIFLRRLRLVPVSVSFRLADFSGQGAALVT